MRNNVRKITKSEYYNMGGMSNPDLYRRQTKSGRWNYYHITDNGIY